MFFFFSSRRRHTRLQGDWSSDVCSSDLPGPAGPRAHGADAGAVTAAAKKKQKKEKADRKSTRLNSSHLVISYAVFCLKKKNNISTDPAYTALGALRPQRRTRRHAIADRT